MMLNEETEESVLDFEFEDIDEHAKNFIDLRKKLDVDVKRNVKTSQQDRRSSMMLDIIL